MTGAIPSSIRDNQGRGKVGDPKALGDGLFEMRHVGKLNTRVLWFFVRDRRIVAVHAIRNKGRTIPAGDIRTARERMHEWLKREN